jgi:hypothetical protein
MAATTLDNRLGFSDWHTAELPNLLHNTSVTSINQIPIEDVRSALNRFPNVEYGLKKITTELGQAALKMKKTSGPSNLPRILTPLEDALEEFHIANKFSSVSATSKKASSNETRESFYASDQVPGGIIVKPGSKINIEFGTLAVSKTVPGQIILDDRIAFDSGLTNEELCYLYEIAIHNGSAQATSVHHTEGVSANNIIGGVLRLADLALGYYVFSHSDHEQAQTTLEDLKRKSSQDLLDAVTTKIFDINSIVAIEYETPKFTLNGGSLALTDTPIKIHFASFEGPAYAPRFLSNQDENPRLFPDQYSKVLEMQRDPSKLFAQSPLFGRIQRYAAVLSIFNQALSNKILCKNINDLVSGFIDNPTVINSIDSLDRDFRSQIDFSELEEHLSKATTAIELSRAVIEGLVLVIYKDKSYLKEYEKLVAKFAISIPPYDGRSDHDYISLVMKEMTGVLTFGALSARNATDPRQLNTILDQFFDFAASGQVRKSVQKFYEIPILNFTPYASGFSNISLRIALASEHLCRSGYAESLKQSLLNQISAEFIKDPYTLSNIDKGIILALVNCIQYCGLDPDELNDRWKVAKVGELSKGDFISLYLESIIAAYPHPKIKDKHDITPEIQNKFFDILIKNKKSSLNITPQDFALLEDFLTTSTSLAATVDWESLFQMPLKAVKVQNSSLSGAARIRQEGAILIAANKIAVDIESVVQNYDSICRETISFIKQANKYDLHNAVDILHGASEFLRRQKRLKSGKASTLISSLQNNVFDCDTACHLYSDILEAFGFTPQFCISTGHAHLVVDDIHFEPRGGVITSQLAAKNKYVVMDILSPQVAAQVLGSIDAVSLVFNPDATQFSLATLLEKNFLKAIKYRSKFNIPGISNFDVNISLNEALALEQTVQELLKIARSEIHALSSCFMLSEQLACSKHCPPEHVIGIQKSIGQAIFDLSYSKLLPFELVKILGCYSYLLNLTPEQTSHLESVMRGHGLRTTESIIEEYLIKTDNSWNIDNIPNAMLAFVNGEPSEISRARELHLTRMSVADGIKSLLMGDIRGPEERYKPLFGYGYRIFPYLHRDLGTTACTQSWIRSLDKIYCELAARDLFRRHNRADLTDKWIVPIKDNLPDDFWENINKSIVPGYTFGVPREQKKQAAPVEQAPTPRPIANSREAQIFGRMFGMSAENFAQKVSTINENRNKQFAKTIDAYIAGGYQYESMSKVVIALAFELNKISSDRKIVLDNMLVTEPDVVSRAAMILAEIEPYLYIRLMMNFYYKQDFENFFKLYGEGFQGFEHLPKMIEVIEKRIEESPDAIINAAYLLQVLKEDEKLPLYVMLAEAYSLRNNTSQAMYYRNLALEKNKQDAIKVLHPHYVREMNVILANHFKDRQAALADLVHDNSYNSKYYFTLRKRVLNQDLDDISRTR